MKNIIFFTVTLLYRYCFDFDLLTPNEKGEITQTCEGTQLIKVAALLRAELLPAAPTDTTYWRSKVGLQFIYDRLPDWQTGSGQEVVKVDFDLDDFVDMNPQEPEIKSPVTFSEVVYALLATIKDEWGEIDVWSLGNADRKGIAKDDSALVKLLKEYEEQGKRNLWR